MIGRKMGEEETRPDPKIWDGHATSAENAAREARGNASLDDQIAQIHRQKGLNQVICSCQGRLKKNRDYFMTSIQQGENEEIMTLRGSKSKNQTSKKIYLCFPVGI